MILVVICKTFTDARNFNKLCALDKFALQVPGLPSPSETWPTYPNAPLSESNTTTYT